MEFFRGPLGSHKNYITHIALANCMDYLRIKEAHEERALLKTPAKYTEFRLFLNAVESLNNIIDYFYYEHEDKIRPLTLGKFKNNVYKKFPELKELSNLANAYKHCVRASGNKKIADLLWARDLQAPQINIFINLNENDLNAGKPLVDAEYKFPWPIEKHEKTMLKAFDFWLKYHNNPNTDELINSAKGN